MNKSAEEIKKERKQTFQILLSNWVGVKTKENYAALESFVLNLPESKTELQQRGEEVKELACDFMHENFSQIMNLGGSGYQAIRKLYDEWISQNNYWKRKLSAKEKESNNIEGQQREA